MTIFAVALILSQPFFLVAHFSWNLEMGTYPIHADSIAIPISQGLFALVLFAPVALLGVWWALSKYPGSVPLLAWNRERQVWSAFWSLCFGFLLLCVLLEIPSDLRWLNLFSLLDDALWLLLFAQLRALVVMKRGLV